MAELSVSDIEMTKRISESEPQEGSLEYGENLTRLRKAAGLSQVELGERIGVAQSIISRFERGERRLYDDILASIAEVLDVTPNDILGITQCKSVNPELAKISRRFVKHLKRLQSLPQRAQERVLIALELALDGAKSSKAS